MSMSIYLIFLPFALIAAVMAYLISYNEWMHHYPTKKEPRKMALEAVVFTLIVFIAIIFFTVYILTHWIEK
jgi:predicted ABC-type exoprotein transport system permease subunit